MTPDEEVILGAAEGRALGLLMTEMMEALIENGALRRCDVAGMLLRAEWRTMMSEENGVTASPSFLPVIEADWTRRFGLTPELSTLRGLNDTWVRDGMRGRPPIEARAIRRSFGK